jgi:transposase
MRFIRDLNPEDRELLKQISEQNQSPQVRERAKCILLSSQKYTIEELMRIFEVSRKTIYNWLTRWEDQGFSGLYNQKGRGRKPLLNSEQEKLVKDWVKAEPKNLKKIVAKVEEEWQIKISKETLKRIIKKLNMVWKRLKRRIGKSPYDWELEVKLPRLLELKEEEKRGEIDLRYFDESGLSLTPCVPYGWQEKGERTTLKSSLSKRVNILGLMNRNQELYYQIHEEKVDSEVVIKFFDKFSQNLKQKTVVILDQASIHTSDSFLAKLPEWQSKNLDFFWLPPYSPQYNLIELLWKFIHQNVSFLWRYYQRDPKGHELPSRGFQASQ